MIYCYYYDILSIVIIMILRYLQTSDPDIREHFLSGEFSVQKTQTSFTAIGRDHAGEQVNRELKTRGITGITRNANSRTRQILIAPILVDISNQMMNRGNAANFSSTKYHQRLSQKDKIKKFYSCWKS